MAKIDRRDFIRQTSLGAGALCLPLSLHGCGKEGGTGPDDSDAVERKTVHVDLSGLLETVLEQEQFTLHIHGQRHRLSPHTAATRESHRARSPWLRDVPDSALTHFAEDVPHASRMPALRWVTGTTQHSGRGAHFLIHTSLHVPAASLARALAAGGGGPSAGSGLSLEGEDPLASCPQQCLQLVNDNVDVYEKIYANSDQYIGYLDTAAAVIFHHPEILNFDADSAAHIKAQHIDAAPVLKQLAYYLCCQGPAYEHDDAYFDGWAVLVPQQDAQGNYLKSVVDSETQQKSAVWQAGKTGELIYDYKFSELTQGKLGQAVRAVLKTVKDDPALEDQNWQNLTGRTTEQVTATSTSGLGATGGGYKMALSRGPDSVHDGVHFSSYDVDADTRSVSFHVANYYNRMLSVYLLYEDVDGNPVALQPGDWSSQISADVLQGLGLETDSLKFYTAVAAPPVLSCVPVLPPLPVTITVDKWPETATRCRVLFGSLGASGGHHYPTEVVGAIMTGVIHYGIPSLILATGDPDALYENASLKALLWKNWSLYFSIAKTVLDVIADSVTGKWDNLFSDAETLFAKIADKMAFILLAKGCVELAGWIAEKMAEGEVEDAIPYAGWVFRAAGAASTLALISETTVEVLASDWVFENVVTSALDIHVTLERDGKDYQFPASATHCEVLAVFSQHTVRCTKTIALPSGTVTAPQHCVLEGMPAGGTVELIALMHSDDGRLVGKGSSGRVPNLINNTSAGSLDVSFAITEFPVPLTATTRYHHKQRLDFDSSSGKHIWQPAKDQPPGATPSDLSCANTGASLCTLAGITLSQQDAMLGYGWQASGTAVASCDGGVTGAQLYQLQNVSLLTDPETSLAHSGCGLAAPVRVAYRLLQDPADPGQDLWVDPRQSTFHVRPVTLAPTVSFNMSSDQSRGRFPAAVDDVALHPLGLLAGISTSLGKLFLLPLASGWLQQDDPTVPVALPRSGPGTRVGLLDDPVALACTMDGAILVLEQTGRRVQAFDTAGNTVKRFAGNSSAVAPLKAESETVRYLDLCVEAKGYIFVLSQVQGASAPEDFRLDLYRPDGTWLSRTTGVTAARMALDFWHNLYTLNYATFLGPAGRVEPSVSEWYPEG